MLKNLPDNILSAIEGRQWKLIPQGEEKSRAEVSSLSTSMKRPTIVGLGVKPIGKKWLHNFGRCGRWIGCLTAGTIVLANQERR
jgi:hypothetical protein